MNPILLETLARERNAEILREFREIHMMRRTKSKSTPFKSLIRFILYRLSRLMINTGQMIERKFLSECCPSQAMSTATGKCTKN